MNIIKTKVNFEKRTCLVSGINLTSGDYNSTKMEFTFDREDGTKVLEMINPSGQLVYLGEIANNEIVLVGKADITTVHENVKYIKYLDGSDNVYWYDKENNKLYNTSWQEIVSFNLEDYTKQTKDCSLFTEEGDYVFEISLYDGDSKLTSAFNKLKVLPQQVSVDDEVAEVYLPIFDEMLSDLSGAISEVDNLNISMTKSGTTATIIITKKDGTQETKNIYDGEKGDTGPYYTPSVDDSGNISWTNNGGLVNPTTKNIKGPKGDKPVKGVDYFTAQDISNMEDYIINGTTSSFNQNAQAKTEAFNQNASSKTTAFNENATSKTTDFNSNATSKTTSFNENATNKTSAYNSNASDKLSAYNNNHTDKLGAYNDNASEKLSAYNSNAEDKIEEFDAHSEEIDNKVEYYKKYSNALLKTTGTGTSLTLDDTAEAPMPIKLAPSELEQETTTGKNKLPYTNDINETINSTKITGVKGTYTIQTTPTATVYQTYVNLVKNYTIQSGDYLHIMNDVANANITFNLKCTDDTILSPTLNSVNRIFDLSTYVGKTISSLRFYVTTSYNGTKITLTPMIVNSATATDFELYTGGIPGPNPEFSTPIHTISGNNTIVLCGKNLFDKTKTTSGKYINSNGEEASYYAYSLSDYIPVQPNTIYSYQGITAYSEYGAYYDKNKTLISAFTESLSVENQHITTPNNCYYVRFTLINTNDNINKFQLEKGIASPYTPYQSQSYPITLGTLEYSKIGNYEDEFIKTSGKNLFDGEFRQGTEGNTTSALNIFSKNDLVLEAGTYTFSCDLSMSTFKYAIGKSNETFPTNNMSWLCGGFQTNQTLTFTINETLHIGVLITRINQTNFSPSDVSSYTFMINKGSTALPYEPYGTDKWYLKKNIGKLVLDGSENWEKQDTWSAVGNETNAFYIEKPANLNRLLPCLCDYLKYVSVDTILNTDDYGISYSVSLIIRMPKSLTDSTALKNWLTSNNMILYYILTSSIFIEITDTTLISQLNALEYALSYQDQTNISQTSNDKPFIISASAFADMNIIISNLTNAIIELGGE